MRLAAAVGSVYKLYKKVLLHQALSYRSWGLSHCVCLSTGESTGLWGHCSEACFCLSVCFQCLLILQERRVGKGRVNGGGGCCVRVVFVLRVRKLCKLFVLY